MKKTLMFILSLAMLVSTLTFGVGAAPEVHEGHVHTEGDTCSVAPASLTAEVCDNCGEQAVVYHCKRNYVVVDTGTHTYGLFKTCTIDYTTSQTVKYCNACQEEFPDGWHPFCDEIHSSCGLGIYATCTIEYY